MLFLFNSVSSYLFFAYKSAIIKADQKEYYINLISYIFTIGSSVVEIICLVVFNNFEIYVVIKVIKTIGQNLAVGWISIVIHARPDLRDMPILSAAVASSG